MTTDWVHTFLSDGVFGTELLAFLKKSEEMIGKGFASFFCFWTTSGHSPDRGHRFATSCLKSSILSELPMLAITTK